MQVNAEFMISNFLDFFSFPGSFFPGNFLWRTVRKCLKALINYWPLMVTLCNPKKIESIVLFEICFKHLSPIKVVKRSIVAKCFYCRQLSSLIFNIFKTNCERNEKNHFKEIFVRIPCSICLELVNITFQFHWNPL